MGIDLQSNMILGKLLEELGWSPNVLADAVNGVLGPGYIARSTVSDWLHHDRLPRDPLPTVVAHLLADTLDREVSLDELWSGRAQPAEFWVPADVGMHLPWTAEGTVEVLDDWLRHIGGSIGMDRRIFLAVSGPSLTAPAWGYVDHLGTRGGSFAALAGDRRSITITSSMVDAVAATTAGIRHLGNTEGGNADTLRFVHHHLTWVARLLRQARFSNSAVADRLLSEWTQLAQLASWMAMDAGRHGLSQRYFTSGLHAAHTAGDRSVGTYLLSDMSEFRVINGWLGDGVDPGRAARDAAELANASHEAARSTPAAVRALAAKGFAKAQAAVGNARGFHAAADEARALLDSPGALDTRPPYLAWFDSGAREKGLAESAVQLAGVSSRDCRALLDDATEQLSRSAADPARTPRSMMFGAAWLSRANVAADDLDRAVPAAQVALSRLPMVRSRRCTLVLRRLEDDLAALASTRRPASVRSLQDQLRASHAA
ncbi:MAG: hypothetical protein ACRDTD_09075 [Pseudonocardiaceae bacterium]